MNKLFLTLIGCLIFFEAKTNQIASQLKCNGKLEGVTIDSRGDNKSTIDSISDNGDRPSEAYTYEKEGDYLVMLVTTNEYGCSDTTYAQHEVIFAAEPPNVFSPNGDGVNDIFYIPGALALRNFHCSIYNRWGRLVYEWSNPAEGWDGSGSNDGVYFYIVTGSRADGSDYKRQGNVTITSGK